MGNLCAKKTPDIQLKNKSKCWKISNCCHDDEFQFTCCVIVHNNNKTKKNLSNDSEVDLSTKKEIANIKGE